MYLKYKVYVIQLPVAFFKTKFPKLVQHAMCAAFTANSTSFFPVRRNCV